MNTELYERFEDKEWRQDDGFIATREFICGKNISLIEKHRQNIKKVMKNKKFRNYMNPYKKTNDHLSKTNTENSESKMIGISIK